MASQFYPPVVGGQERVVWNLSRALTRRGHEVAVATLHAGGPRYEIDDGVRIYRIGGTFRRAGRLFTDPERRHVPPIRDPEAARALERVIRREKPDVVHAHDWLLHSLLGARRRHRIPLVVSLHDYSLVCANKRLIHHGAPCDGPGLTKCLRCANDSYGFKGVPVAAVLRASRSRVRSRVDRFLPVSEAVATLSGLRTGGVPFTVLPNFMPDALFSSNSFDQGGCSELPASEFICFVGDVTHDKGADVLLEAHRRLGRRVPLVLVGRPLLPALGGPITNVSVLGSRPHAFVLEALRRCAVAVVPSVWAEPFSLAALEAMLAGRPVVASRTGGLADVVGDGETGILIPPGDAGALADALDRLLADAGLRARMGENGRRRAAEQFGESAVVPIVEQVYREVVELVTPGARG